MTTATTSVTVPFEARDLLSGAVRKMRSVIQGATDDLIDFRRTSGDIGEDFVSSSRRAKESAADLGREIGGAADEARRMDSFQMGDLFGRARHGADDFRTMVHRAESEVRGMSDAHVQLKAHDGITPVLDGISSRLSNLAAAAGGIIIGSGVKDAMFGDVTDYYSASARSAAFMPADVREQGLSTADELYLKGYFSSRSDAANQLADAAPLVSDKSQISNFLASSAKIQKLRPDSGAEEINRALTQSASTFKESYDQVADSMLYAFEKVGDRQQDLFDTFWEYSGYFKKTGANSGQMANFLTQSMQNGSFNFDKPADFIKETFGGKALNTGDMANYFTLRGAGKNEAQHQAQAFTDDINSGDQQRVKGAIMALVGDLASQTANELKQSLTTLGSATAEDNGDAIMKTYQVPFQQAPSSITGTTDRLVNAQKAANPMQDYIETRRQIDKQMQDIGANLSSAALPVMKEFNSLISDNQAEISALGTKIADFVSGVTSFYNEHFSVVNKMIIGLLGIVAVKKTAEGIKKTYDLFSGTRESRKGGPFKTESAGNAESITVRATHVYINGPVSGDRGRGDQKRKKRGGSRKGGARGTGPSSTGSRKSNWFGGRRNQAPEIDIPKKGLFETGTSKSIWSRMGSGSKWLKGASGLLKGVAVIGTAANVGIGAYDMYQTAKDEGWKEAISTKGGSTAGSLVGGVAGGALGSLAGPIGTAAGAAVGSWAGEKLGALADSAGWTRATVDFVSSTTSAIKSWFGFGKKEQPAKPAPPPEAKVTFGNMTPENAQKIRETFTSFQQDVAKNGMKHALTNALDQSGVTKAADILKDKLVGVFKGTDSKKAKDNIHAVGAVSSKSTTSTKQLGQAVGVMWKGSNSLQAQQNVRAVGTAAQRTGEKAKQMGQTAKGSTQEIVRGAAQAGRSFSGVSSAAQSAASQTRQHLLSLRNISSEGSSWGSNLISMVASGIRSKFPTLTSVVSQAADVIRKYLGFHSPTEEGPASDSDRWAGNFVNMFADGLRHEPIQDQMKRMAGAMRSGIEGMQSTSLTTAEGPIPVASSLSIPAPAANRSVTIQSIQMDFGSLGPGISNFNDFAAALKSPQGRSLIRQVFGEELYNVLEMGG
ncbi:tail tape measure protein [Paenibacillus sp. JX-17]|uniref:Tail tape measure protein n=1 Tax=Paenibacillus lacisoli TaxID=3064525 RepID=A0ABT9CHT5_9BACL|nr:tail tape measure protein [Paenibacillus sp. JX-17]MDO7908425.1 tail tape measure protein [Paenibacillus sp. JX-17]